MFCRATAAQILCAGHASATPGVRHGGHPVSQSPEIPSSHSLEQAPAAATAAEEEEDEGEVDETGVEPKDVELVMTQVRLFLALFGNHSIWVFPKTSQSGHRAPQGVWYPNAQTD